MVQNVSPPNCLVLNRFLFHKCTRRLGASAAALELQEEGASVRSDRGVPRLQCLVLLCSRALIACFALSRLCCEVPATVTRSPFC